MDAEYQKQLKKIMSGSALATLAGLAAQAPAGQRQALAATENAYLNFTPRPDRPELFDEQHSFVFDRVPGVAGLIKGNASGGSECAAHKIARFIQADQEAPRPDTPFWIVGPNLDKTSKTFWKEKLYGHGHLLKDAIDWDRISWENHKQRLPKEVPLKPWIHGKRPHCNWSLVFKSTQQNVLAKAGESIGGFCFTEPFEHEQLIEVLRGCREYNFPGSKFFEFTPGNPVTTAWLEEMIRESRLPKGWKIYRCNTELNDAIDESWIEEFASSVSPEQRATRLRGDFGSYEGQIYKSFNPAIHLYPNQYIQMHPLRDVIWKRSIDWGAGPENAFVFLWWVRDTTGRYFVVDEYYSTESTTWEEHARRIHEKDGYKLIREGDAYRLIPLTPVPRWRYNHSAFQQTYAPHDRPDLCRELERYCIPIAAGRSGPNSVHRGIELIQRLLKYTDEDGKPSAAFDGLTEPRLFIHKTDCPQLSRQLPGLRWNPRALLQNSLHKSPQSIQLKEDDHAPDALRVGLFSDYSESSTGVYADYVAPKPRPQVRHRRRMSRSFYSR